MSEKIPTILIVVQGGHNTLGTIMKAVENDVPILVLEVRINFKFYVSSFIFSFSREVEVVQI